MSVLIRIGVFRSLCGSAAQAPKLASLQELQKRTIMGKLLRSMTPMPEKRPPFPYETKDYTGWHVLFDHTTHRFDPNTKVVVVDGPIACGKSELAAKLADEFGMKHFPEPNSDDFYITDYGIDLRSLDPKLPANIRSYDHRSFNRDPSHPHAARLQFMMYDLRYNQYMDALIHILNTGQGVVLERSVYSDIVFCNAMHENGFMKREDVARYEEIRKNTLMYLLRPHLIVYLDTPIDVVRQRVKERNLEHEKDSKILTDGFLNSIESNYKLKFLKDINKHAEILVYDWSGKGDVEIIVEDIERIEFDNYDDYDSKSKDWRKAREADWAELRMELTNERYIYQNFLCAPIITDAIMGTGQDREVLNNVLAETPGLKYEPGFNEEMGDKGVLFKTRANRKYCKTTVM